jgi:hypothetical protein
MPGASTISSVLPNCHIPEGMLPAVASGFHSWPRDGVLPSAAALVVRPFAAAEDWLRLPDLSIGRWFPVLAGSSPRERWAPPALRRHSCLDAAAHTRQSFRAEAYKRPDRDWESVKAEAEHKNPRRSRRRRHNRGKGECQARQPPHHPAVDTRPAWKANAGLQLSFHKALHRVRRVAG